MSDNPTARRTLGYVVLVVRDYDEAIAYYTSVLGFALIEDTRLTDEKRWVLVAPSPACETRLLLARGVGTEQVSRIGNQTGGRVFLFLHTDDFWRDYNEFTSRGGAVCAAAESGVVRDGGGIRGPVREPVGLTRTHGLGGRAERIGPTGLQYYSCGNDRRHTGAPPN
jgi:catechol 2,3-dioxygenase-like lactoylglutathione lyase family enzyme